MLKQIAWVGAVAALGGCAFGPLHVNSPATGPAAASSVSRSGGVLLEGQLRGARTVQYLATDINAMKVSILDARAGNAVVASSVYSGSSLASHLSGSSFSFQVNNLEVNDGTYPAGYSYNAEVQAYLDSAATALIGSTTTSTPFTVLAGQTTAITSFSTLNLIATPVGNATATSSNAVSIVDNPPPAITFN